METLSSGLVVYGPLGLWALAATIALVALFKENGRLRDSHTAALAELNDTFTAKLEALGKEHASSLAATALAFEAKVTTLGTTHTANLREQSDRYDRQISEMHQRTFTIVTTLADKMSALADSISRHQR